MTFGFLKVPSGGGGGCHRLRTFFPPEIIQFFLVASLGFHNFENSGEHLSFYLSTNDIWMFVDAESSRRGKMVGTKI